MADEVKTEEKPTIKCPLCGAEGYHEIEVDPNDKDAYLISMLGKVPFRKVYSLMDGAIAIVAEECPPERLRKRIQIATSLGNALKDHDELSPLFSMALSLLHTACSIVEYAVRDTKITLDPTSIMDKVGERITELEGDDKKALINGVVTYIENYLQDSTSIPVSFLSNVAVRHTEITTMISASCFDANFWGGTRH